MKHLILIMALMALTSCGVKPKLKEVYTDRDGNTTEITTYVKDSKESYRDCSRWIAVASQEAGERYQACIREVELNKNLGVNNARQY